MYQDYKDLLSAFQSHGVKYLVCRRLCGYLSLAAALYEGPRPFHKSGPCHAAQATHAALAEFGAPLKGITPEDFTDCNSFFRFGREPKGFDILPSIPGVDFDAAWERRVETLIDTASGLKANFISADDLIASKLASGRARDLADVEDIRKAAESQRPRR